jgi:hypothetical protein
MNDKQFAELKKTIDKQRAELSPQMEKFLREELKEKGMSQTDINAKADEGMEIARKQFQTTMKDNYFRKRFLENEIRSKKSDFDMLGSYVGKDRELVLFADIQGIGYFDMKATDQDKLIAVGKMLAIEAVIFAAGALTGGAASIGIKALQATKR